MTTHQGARARARAEITAAIKDTARRQLADEGAAKLSLRAVARELGMVSSALYRYFPSRDDLLTDLIIDAYDAVGEVAERAWAEARATATGPDGADPLACWTAVCSAARAWGLAHPHEYALIYGSPVPGYSAPQSTVRAAARVSMSLLGIVRDARRSGELTDVPLPAALHTEAQRMVADFAPDLPVGTAAALVAAWAQLFGLIGFEVFGQFHRVVEEREAFFVHAVERLGRGVGLVGRGPAADS
ncbi:TetR/AcrR family transcriptional regulator [Streptomyces sp. J2-1]|uniref:TetR/AcrR family transcriptional regulator n=1 Tax=Streptomyces corallincola TaxID=2851888 RepID=UPI001C381849|nr:TetR/AcrR family transcriptional regulator [Streptomyces corallincola]MBV2352878.1 TetR/AcrR family transcriptional regulator [Streptomyces corallincola]